MCRCSTQSLRKRKALRELSDAITGSLPTDMRSWSISTASLFPGAKTVPIAAEVKKWKGSDVAFLYFFRLTNKVDIEKVKCAYADAKAHKTNERAYSRLMAISAYLYVGRSQNISQRLKEHLGFGAKRTYAMQLAHWAPTLRLELEFTCAKYRPDVKDEILQALEDTLWDQLKPMFGRKGKR